MSLNKTLILDFLILHFQISLLSLKAFLPKSWLWELIFFCLSKCSHNLNFNNALLRKCLASFPRLVNGRFQLNTFVFDYFRNISKYTSTKHWLETWIEQATHHPPQFLPGTPSVAEAKIVCMFQCSSRSVFGFTVPIQPTSIFSPKYQQ